MGQGKYCLLWYIIMMSWIINNNIIKAFKFSNITNFYWDFPREYVQKNESHKTVLGHKTTDDRMLFHMRFVKKNSTEKDLNIKNDIHYPSTGSLKNTSITCIEIFDMMKDHGGSVKIINGGPGEKNVTFRLESQPGYGIDFLIKIYGYYFI